MNEVVIVLSRVEKKKRAQLDLRGHGLEIDETASQSESLKSEIITSKDDGSSTEGESQEKVNPRSANVDEAKAILTYLSSTTIKIIKSSWIQECFKRGKLVPVKEYIILEGRRRESKDNVQFKSPQKRKREPTPNDSIPLKSLQHPADGSAILARARAEASESSPKHGRDFGARSFGDKSKSTFTAPYAAGASLVRHQAVHLLQQTTSEYEGLPESELPPLPDWVDAETHYACQRSTPELAFNKEFLDMLKDIRLARLLTADEIGVRAYSTSIAAIAAYPYKLTSPREILRLPGCDIKIANLFVEYANSGKLVAAESAKSDPDLQILRLFYDIWGVGATTAREFYIQRGWRDLDDVVEFGWSTLSRVQQIGVKYYDEFKAPIPRLEVEEIARIIHFHAVKVRDDRIQSLIVGGYRRGKAESGDVDLLISHPDSSCTANLVSDIVTSLETEGWITHTLLLALTSTHRDQQTLPFRSVKNHVGGAGFDTLDKALVVWQDPSWPTKHSDLENDPRAKNPAPHRRVDIIISPWRTVGCAVAGWSSGTTFQRDLRRYAKNVLTWKFDSSGVRERAGGKCVDLDGYYLPLLSPGIKSEDGVEEQKIKLEDQVEVKKIKLEDEVEKQKIKTEDDSRGVHKLIYDGEGVEVVHVHDRMNWKHKGRAKTMVEAEQRVFEGMGLEWREPWERCTG